MHWTVYVCVSFPCINYSMNRQNLGLEAETFKPNDVLNKKKISFHISYFLFNYTITYKFQVPRSRASQCWKRCSRF